MTVLEEILSAVKKETDFHRSKTSLKNLKRKVNSLPPTRGFRKALAAGQFGLIAEVKFRSPSMGRMSSQAVVNRAHVFYNEHPIVKAISVLTNSSHFGGSPKKLSQIQKQTRKPILRKDFIFDEFQVYHAREMGADAILLMTNVVKDPAKFEDLHELARSLGLDVLCEVHSEEDIARLPKTVQICGINSRKFSSDWRFRISRIARVLKTDSSVDLSAFDLADHLPDGALRIAESGVNELNVGSVCDSEKFAAALVGTSLLKCKRPSDVGDNLEKFAEAIRAARAPGTTTSPVKHPVSSESRSDSHKRKRSLPCAKKGQRIPA